MLCLAVGFGLLVASVLLPFATLFSEVRRAGAPDPIGRIRVTFWSFMHVQESFGKVGDSWEPRPAQWLFFSAYWNWWGPGSGTVLPSGALIPTFVAQLVSLFLGAVAFKVKRAWSVLPLPFISMTLIWLYYGASQIFQADLHIGFWLSIPSTALFTVAAALSFALSKRDHDQQKL